jgi:hypothetical protein
MKPRELLAVTYSEFDNHAGPQLRHSFPPDIISKEMFEPIADYVILGKHLCERVITVKLEKWQLLSYPIAIEDNKYDRNTLSFAFGFVISFGAKTGEYGKVLKNIGSFFQDLEIERDFISNGDSSQLLPGILEKIFSDLTTKAYTFLHISKDPPSYLPIKLFRSPVFSRLIEDYEVPMFRQDRVALNQLPWDISFQHLILHIDGVNHVRRIVNDAEMDLDFVKRSLALLEFYGAIVVSDIFRFSNIYALDSELGMQYLSDPNVISEMIDFAYTPELSAKGLLETPPNPRDIISFLLRLQPGVTVAQALLQMVAATAPQQIQYYQQTSNGNPKNFLKGVDISRLIAFAQVSGIIRRVYEYPVYLPNPQHKILHSHHASVGGNESVHQTPRNRYDSDNSLQEHFQSPHEEVKNTQERPMTARSADSRTGELTTRMEALEQLRGMEGNRDGMKSFSRLTSRSKSVVGRSYLKETLQTDDAVRLMDGTECLDYYCCRYSISFLEIINHPNIQIVYK